MQSCLAHQ
ncbi:hypothetical protein D030_1314A, partial [Vibrio parahaemolyticus AQ3810]